MRYETYETRSRFSYRGRLFAKPSVHLFRCPRAVPGFGIRAGEEPKVFCLARIPRRDWALSLVGSVCLDCPENRSGNRFALRVCLVRSK